MQTAADCANTAVVFNAINTTVQSGATIPTDTVFTCSYIFTTTLSATQDWAVFRLSSSVAPSVATPAVVGTSELQRAAPLMMIGHP
jgi:hypothetical protein